MKAISINDLDYRQILISHYRQLELNEDELVVLLLIDSLNKKEEALITGEQLSLKMTYDAKKIDEIIVSLMNKGFLEYASSNSIMVTSLKPGYEKIVSYVLREVGDDNSVSSMKQKEDDMSKVLTLLEERMGRNLTPIELELVHSWFSDNVSLEVIMSSIDEASLKGKKITAKQVDKLIVKNLQQKDIAHEGYTSVDEKTKLDIEKAMEIASYDWVNKEDD